MFGIMPKPLPDELLYSLLARMRAHLGVPANTWRKVLPWPKGQVQIDLPGHMQELVLLFPPGSTLTADDLIGHHTLLPFLAAFLEPDRVREVKDTMTRTPSNWTGFPGIFGDPENRLSAFLRFCPACAEDDKCLHGEPYWHRLHQVPCVVVCPTHGLFLANSSIRTGAHRGMFPAAADYIDLGKTVRQTVDLSDVVHRVLLDVAHDVEWLLSSPSLGIKWESIQAFYLQQLQRKRLATGNVSWKKLAHVLVEYYPADALNRLGCYVEPGQFEGWIRRLYNRGVFFRPPVWHLLLIRFLGYTAGEFFSRLGERRHPFLEGPWPCLNAVAPHFKERVITHCDIEVRNGQPKGTFRCECGFHYRRNGPDNGLDDQFRVDSVCSYGPLWDNTLRTLWADTGVSRREIASRLGSTERAVYHARNRLGLPSRGQSGGSVFLTPRKARVAALLADVEWVSRFRELWTNSELTLQRISCDLGINVLTAKNCAFGLGLGDRPSLRGSRRQVPWPKWDIERCHMVWLCHVRENPNATRTHLKHSASGLYLYLKKHDPEWLEQHLPKPTRNPYRVDWSSRDRFLSSQVSAAAARIRKSPGYPRAVTWESLSKELRTVFSKEQRKMLPLTVAAIEQETDSPASITIRRLWWKAEQYRRDGKVPKQWDLARGYSDVSHPEIQAALNEILASFEVSSKKKVDGFRFEGNLLVPGGKQQSAEA